jgi:hypothetical protein
MVLKFCMNGIFWSLQAHQLSLKSEKVEFWTVMIWYGISHQKVTVVLVSVNATVAKWELLLL